ncbi:hypothetical protein BJ742DRAFT_468323 [Cladochytrium replicatum]|nr:hypothetical protein BJ742DRAFT_468323 [Cladochytrium replicatum]
MSTTATTEGWVLLSGTVLVSALASVYAGYRASKLPKAFNWVLFASFAMMFTSDVLAFVPSFIPAEPKVPPLVIYDVVLSLNILATALKTECNLIRFDGVFHTILGGRFKYRTWMNYTVAVITAIIILGAVSLAWLIDMYPFFNNGVQLAGLPPQNQGGATGGAPATIWLVLVDMIIAAFSLSVVRMLRSRWQALRNRQTVRSGSSGFGPYSSSSGLTSGTAVEVLASPVPNQSYPVDARQPGMIIAKTSSESLRGHALASLSSVGGNQPLANKTSTASLRENQVLATKSSATSLKEYGAQFQPLNYKPSVSSITGSHTGPGQMNLVLQLGTSPQPQQVQATLTARSPPTSPFGTLLHHNPSYPPYMTPSTAAAANGWQGSAGNLPPTTNGWHGSSPISPTQQNPDASPWAEPRSPVSPRSPKSSAEFGQRSNGASSRGRRTTKKNRGASVFDDRSERGVRIMYWILSLQLALPVCVMPFFFLFPGNLYVSGITGIFLRLYNLIILEFMYTIGTVVKYTSKQANMGGSTTSNSNSSNNNTAFNNSKPSGEYNVASYSKPSGEYNGASYSKHSGEFYGGSSSHSMPSGEFSNGVYGR